MPTLQEKVDDDLTNAAENGYITVTHRNILVDNTGSPLTAVLMADDLIECSSNFDGSDGTDYTEAKLLRQLRDACANWIRDFKGN